MPLRALPDPVSPSLIFHSDRLNYLSVAPVRPRAAKHAPAGTLQLFQPLKRQSARLELLLTPALAMAAASRSALRMLRCPLLLRVPSRMASAVSSFLITLSTSR